MRTALSLGLLLLAVVLALDFQSGVFSFGAETVETIHADVNAGRSVRIFTCGATLEAKRFGAMKQTNAIFVDGRMLRYYVPDTGLRVVTIPPGDALATLSTFQIPRDSEAPRKLRELLESVPIDTAVALSSFRTIQPKGRDSEDRRQLVTDLLLELGARTDPTNDNLVSWGLLSLKRPQGWVPLSEAYSRTKGMMIAFNLEDNRSKYDGFDAILCVDQSRETTLLGVLDQAIKPSRVEPVGMIQISRNQYASFKLPLVEGAHITWRYVHLGRFPTFDCKLGIPEDAFPHVPGARCSLLINGEVAATRELGRDAGTINQWVDWQVDLSAFANRWVTLELRAEPISESPPTSVFWGAATLKSTPTGAKPNRGAELLMRHLDLNEDGIIGRPEVFEYLNSQDIDGDGILTLDEALHDPTVLGVDENGDRQADQRELATWFDQLLDPVDFYDK